MHVELVQKRFERDAAILSPAFLRVRNWLCNTQEFPTLDITFLGKKPVRLRLTCEQWDEVPPKIEILNSDGAVYNETLPGGAFNPGPHEKNRKSFICHPGSYEYHTYSGHLTDHWEGYRRKDGWNLPGILDQLSTFWRKRMGR